MSIVSFRNGNRDLYVMSAAGASLRQVTADPAQERYPDWSPDGDQLAFYSDKTGRQEIWVVSRQSRDSDWQEPWQLTFDGGQHPRWSPDGRYISFNWSNRLWVEPVEGGEPTQLVGPSLGPTSLPFADWAPDSQTIFFKTATGDGVSGFWSVPIGGGEPTLLVDFDDPSRPSLRYEFATDGRSFFFTIADQ